jgi:hypothetical protein
MSAQTGGGPGRESCALRFLWYAEGGGHADLSSEKPPGVEDIYVLRSLREQRSTPGDFCATAKIGFAAKIQDRYVFKAVVTRAPDGKVIDAISHPAARASMQPRRAHDEQRHESPARWSRVKSTGLRATVDRHDSALAQAIN